MTSIDAGAAGHERTHELSPREREVLRLLALGHTDQTVAAELVVSVRDARGPPPI